jgi:hypothetical protein
MLVLENLGESLNITLGICKFLTHKWLKIKIKIKEAVTGVTGKRIHRSEDKHRLEGINRSLGINQTNPKKCTKPNLVSTPKKCPKLDLVFLP